MSWAKREVGGPEQSTFGTRVLFLFLFLYDTENELGFVVIVLVKFIICFSGGIFHISVT